MHVIMQDGFIMFGIIKLIFLIQIHFLFQNFHIVAESGWLDMVR